MKIFLVFVIVSMINSVRSKDICEAFNHNNQTIDFLFRRDFGTNSTRHNIVIRGFYWTVDYKHSENKMTIKDREGKPAPAFESPLSETPIGAVCVAVGDGCHVLIFYRERPKTVKRLILTDSNDKDITSMKFITNKTFELNPFPPDLKPDIVYLKGSADIDMLTRNGSKVSVKRFRVRHDSDPESYSLIQQNQPEDWDSFLSKDQVMAVTTQTLITDKTTKGFVVLFKNNRTIAFCWLNPNENCKPQTFLDCSTGPVQPSGSGNWIIHLMIVLAVIVIIGTAVCLVLYCSRRQNEEEAKNPVDKKDNPVIPAPIGTQPDSSIRSGDTMKDTKSSTTTTSSPESSPGIKQMSSTVKTQDSTKTTDDKKGDTKAKTGSKTKEGNDLGHASSKESLGGTPKFLADKGYKLEKQIGEGAFSKVYKARDKKGNVLACKRFDLTLEEHQVWRDKCLKQEMMLMKKLSKLDNKNVIKTVDHIKTRRQAFIFMQFAENGSIKDYLEKFKKPIEESKCKFWFKQIANAIQFLHNQGVAHRDLKPDNFLLDNNYQTVLVTDFGFSAISMGNDKIWKDTKCGTELYKAPEILNLQFGKAYDAKIVDMWALGVCLYEMLYYCYPFPFDSLGIPMPKILDLMKNKRFYRDPKINVTVSKAAEDLYKGLLEFDTNKRMTAKQLYEHYWFK